MEIKNNNMKTNGYWVYTHETPDGMVYVGRSSVKKTSRRWIKANYRRCSLGKYIDIWGWDNIKHKVIKDGLTKEESYLLEDEIITFLRNNDVCINKNTSGGLRCDGKWSEYYLKNQEERKEYMRKYNEANRIKKKMGVI